MLRICKILILALAGCLLGNPLQAQKYDNYTGWAVRTDPVLPERESHPSLYFHSDEVEALRLRSVHSDYANLWQRIQQDAQFFRTRAPEKLNANDRPRMAKTLAFWALMQNDSLALQKSIAALLLAYDGVPKSGAGDFDEIYRATWLQNYCAAYDWVHDRLTATQDSTIRAHLAEETQWLRDNLTAGERLAPRPHNHRSKPAWAIATAALTLSDHPQAADWLQYALEQMNSVTRYMFSADGIYREGGHYWMFSAVNFIPFLWHYKNVSGVDLFPDYQPAFEWPVKIRMGQGWMPNHEDSYLKPAPTHMVAGAYREAATDLHSTAPLAEILQWHFGTTTIFERDYTGATNDVTWEIDEFLLYDNTIPATPPDVAPTIKLDGGQVVLRNRWQGGPGHRYLLFHGVPEADNHNHPDQLSFMLAANDAYLIADAGYGPRGFSDDRRFSWYIKARAHNVVTANFFPPRDARPDSTPPTPHFFDSPFFDFVEKQSGFALPAGVSQRRAIAFIDEDYWVVTDIMAGGQPDTEFRTYLHGRGNFTLDDHHVSWTTRPGRYGPAARVDAYLLPREATISQDTGYISLFKDESAQQYVAWQQSGAEALFMQILVPGEPSAVPPVVADSSAVGYLHAAVSRGDTTDVFLLQKETAVTTAQGITTDATFLWTRTQANRPVQLAFREGSTFALEGNLEVSTVPAATLALSWQTPPTLDVVLAPVEQTIELQLRWLQAPPLVQAVRVNGRQVAFEVQADGRLQVAITPEATTSVEPIPGSQPSRFALLQNYPNPFNAGTRLRFSVTRPGRYGLAIFNLLGQRVRVLVDAHFDGGEHELTWDGQDDTGASLPTGVYFAELRHENTPLQVTKMLLIK